MDTNFKLSTYQQNILNYIDNNTGNLLVDAKAGSGKTSTLLLIANKVYNQNKKCTFLAFNKSIVDELSKKLQNTDCMIKTIHSLGLSFIRSYLMKKFGMNNYTLNIDGLKLNKFMKPLINQICGEDIKNSFEDTDYDTMKETFNDILDQFLKIIQFIRFYNVDITNEESVKDLIDTKCNCEYFIDPKRYGLQNYYQVLTETMKYIDNTFKGETQDSSGKYVFDIDFTDMTYFPVKLQIPVPYSVKQYLDYILVDESQDLSILQQIFIKQLNTGNSRYIFVGDKKQAIYGFTGADTNSIDNIKKNFVLEELPLNICYRCPEKVIKIAKTIVPDIESNSAREDKGNVQILKKSDLKNILKPGDMIISRTNNTLVDMYIDFVFKQHYQVKFKNDDVVKGIIKDIDRCNREYIRRYNKHENIDLKLYSIMMNARIPYKKSRRDKAQQKFMDDQAERLIKEKIEQDNNDGKVISKSNYSVYYLSRCIKEFKDLGSYRLVECEDDPLTKYCTAIQSFISMFLEQNTSVSLKAFTDFIEQFLTCNATKDVPILSTIHKMKGSEADNVFIIDYPNFPYEFEGQDEESKQQEKNLQYVALTRAKKTLNLVLLDSKEGNTNIDEKNMNCIEEITNLIGI